MNQESKVCLKIIRRRRRVERNRRWLIFRSMFDSKAIRKRQELALKEFKSRLEKQLTVKVKAEVSKLTLFQKIINKIKSLWKKQATI